MRILVVEDEQELAASLAEYLEKRGFEADIADTLYRAEDCLLSGGYNCVLLDLTLPDGDGLRLIPWIKSHTTRTGVIVLTARGELEDKITGLTVGADDYLAKPFSLAELHARLIALQRRMYGLTDNIMTIGNISLPLDSHDVKILGMPIELTRMEYVILRYLALNNNRTVTRVSLAEHIWGDKTDDMFSFEVLSSHIKNLRKKLADAGCAGYIKTVYGIGYVLQPSNEVAK